MSLKSFQEIQRLAEIVSQELNRILMAKEKKEKDAKIVETILRLIFKK